MTAERFVNIEQAIETLCDFCDDFDCENCRITRLEEKADAELRLSDNERYRKAVESGIILGGKNNA